MCRLGEGGRVGSPRNNLHTFTLKPGAEDQQPEHGMLGANKNGLQSNKTLPKSSRKTRQPWRRHSRPSCRSSKEQGI